MCSERISMVLWMINKDQLSMKGTTRKLPSAFLFYPIVYF